MYDSQVATLAVVENPQPTAVTAIETFAAVSFAGGDTFVATLGLLSAIGAPEASRLVSVTDLGASAAVERQSSVATSSLGALAVIRTSTFLYASTLEVLATTGVSVTSRTDARAWSFSWDGHEFYVLHLGDTGTFVYDATTQFWSQWVTTSYPTWNAERGVVWRGRVLAADRDSGEIREVSFDTFLDDAFRDTEHKVSFLLSVRGRTSSSVHSLRAVIAPVDEPVDMSLQWTADQGLTYTNPISLTVPPNSGSADIAWRALGNMRTPGRVFTISDTNGPVRISDIFGLVDGVE